MSISKIIILDDDEENVDLLSYYLKKNDYNVICYTQPLKFLSDIQKGLSSDVLFLDIHMPMIDGLGLLGILRTDHIEFVQTCHIVALTALVMEGDEEKCLEAGADDYISKPYKLRSLLLLIQKLSQKK
jgi:CheY-like chemotaxis protein